MLRRNHKLATAETSTRVLATPPRKPETLREAVTLVVRTALAETGVPASLHSMLTLKITERSEAELREMATTVIGIADFLKPYLAETK